ncbi:MAG: 2-dehydropantoate 2-reductase [Chloroflexi bacterium]|nr:2-dehydropantoate 2-reductase [Chloroflexota bacterium]
MMRITVVGAGWTGGLYGGVLARAGQEVGFLARGAHLQAIRSHGLQIRSADFGTFTVDAPASDDPADLGQADLVIFAVKMYDLELAAQALEVVLAPDGRVLTLQNGLEAPDHIARIVGPERVLIGTTALETTILEPGVIGHVSPGHVVTIAAYNGPPTDVVQHIAVTVREAGINTHIAGSGRQALWDKACMLIPIATVTSVCRTSVGQVRDVPEARAVVEKVLAELVAVALADGYDVSAARERAISMWGSLPAAWKTSMMRDFERGNRTELEWLTGALVRLADKYAVEAPVSRAIYGVLKLRQALEGAVAAPAGAAAAGG